MKKNLKFVLISLSLSYKVKMFPVLEVVSKLLAIYPRSGFIGPEKNIVSRDSLWRNVDKGSWQIESKSLTP